MKGFLCIVRELMFRLKLYWFGVRFYSRDGSGDLPVSHTVEYRLDDEHKVNFNFYKVECFDVVMRRGEMVGENYTSFIIQAFLNDHFPEEVQYLDGRCFFFNGYANRFICSDEQTMALILDVYLDFLKSSFYKAKKQKAT